MVVQNLLSDSALVYTTALRKLETVPYFHEAKPYLTVLVLLGLLWLARGPQKHPWAKSSFAYYPRLVSGSIWALGSLQIMTDAYKTFQDKACRVVRPDTDLLIIPAHAVPEVSTLKDEVASNLHALEQDLNARFTGIGGFRNSHLHDQYVQKKLTPQLMHLVPAMVKEVERCMAAELSVAENDWQEVALHPLLTKLSARVSARLMLGEDYSTSNEWLEIATGFLHNFLLTVTVFRFYPSWLHPLLYYIVPTRYVTTGYAKRIKKMLHPGFADLLKQQQSSDWEPSEPDQGATWGMEHISHLASGKERTADFLVHSEILLIMASIPTTVITETNALLDLTAMPKYAKLVREELLKVSAEEEPFTLAGFKKLYKLDSFLRESQRLNPPTLIGLRRIMKQDYVLKSGILLPKGAYVCAPVYVIQNDAKNTTDPEKFDGLRSYNQRLNAEGEVESTKHTFISTEPTVLAFGLGRTACPGRYLADVTVKTIVAKLITEFDMKFPNGKQQRPQNTKVHEFNMPDPSVTVLMKRRAH